MAKMHAWIARYKNTEIGAVVIDATPIRAKNRFHERMKGGELKDVHLTDQVIAEGMTPDVITSDRDPRIKRLGYKVNKPKPEPEAPVESPEAAE
jgi:hypothetical protein